MRCVPHEQPLRLCDLVECESARRFICGAGWDKKEDVMACGLKTNDFKRVQADKERMKKEEFFLVRGEEIRKEGR